MQQGSVLGASAPAGIYLQPYLYQLPRAFGGLPKGSLLFSCNYWPFDFTKPFPFASTNIQLYASTDAGLTWELVSTVAQGGPPDTTNGATPVWEPFLLLHENRLICYYSDQRDPNFGQKLAHQTSTDLRTWGPVVNDATGTTYAERPGMTTVAQLSEHRWIMTYEFGAPVDPANPDQLPCVTTQQTDGNMFAAARSKHAGGVNAAFADGSVRFITNGISQPVWQGMGTKAGGEVVTLD